MITNGYIKRHKTWFLSEDRKSLLYNFKESLCPRLSLLTDPLQAMLECVVANPDKYLPSGSRG
jgi:hypothetical protein